ncbi:MAG: GRRM system radical SAM/SPASM domain protein [Chloroflexota bacterium]|nr:GRRM system radical SAM/SPASM domain protein [Chloroflexota bacterium]
METPPLTLNKIQALVLQPTPLCNINCRYCYLPDRTVNRVMTSAVLTRVLEAFFSSSLLAERVVLLWHAGEPLVVPLAFYHETLALVEHFNTRGVAVIPTLQTNGMRLTQQWCDFIKQHHIRVGVSLDGPQHIHDHSRVDRAGKGTFVQAMRGIELLQQNGIEPSIIMVLTKYALDYPDEIWHFFRNQHLTNLAFNIEEVNGAHTHSSLDHEKGIQDKYKQFLKRILELRDQCEQPPFVREIDTFLERIYHLSEPVRSQENRAGAIVSVDVAGNVSTFASELLTMTHPRYGDFLLGNIFAGTLEEMLSSPKLQAINREVQCGVMQCQQSCAYFDFCGGGSPANKLSEHGTFDVTETLYCQLKIQATMDAVLEHVERRDPGFRTQV